MTAADRGEQRLANGQRRLRERTDLGELGDVAALMGLIPVARLALVDVGCG
jgi:hypothetical protein